MILGILKLFLTVLPGPIFEYLKSKNVLEMAVVKAETERRRLKQEVLLKELDHWIAWLPRFLMGISIASYIFSVIFVSIFWRLEWSVQELPKDFKQIMFVVVAGYFLDSIMRRATRR